MADAHAGKAGRCPQCKRVLTVPPLSGRDSIAQAVFPDRPARARPPVLGDSRLFDAPPADATADGQAGDPDEVEEAYRNLRALEGRWLLREEEEVPERRLPWVIDIFLYPLNRAGLSILLLCAGIPLLLRIVLRFTMILSGAFGPVIIFWVLFIVLHWSALFLLALYVNWYMYACIRDSAAGGIRASNTIAATPGFGELFGQGLTTVATVLACMAPALLYLYHTRSVDGLFWTLYGLGGFLFPMALLAVVMFESLRALNPLLLVGSVRSTFLPYFLLVPFCYALCVLIPVAGYYVKVRWPLGYLLLFLAYYQLLVLAHLLGRFYWKNEERLNWDT